MKKKVAKTESNDKVNDKGSEGYPSKSPIPIRKDMFINKFGTFKVKVQFIDKFADFKVKSEVSVKER